MKGDKREGEKKRRMGRETNRMKAHDGEVIRGRFSIRKRREKEVGQTYILLSNA